MSFLSSFSWIAAYLLATLASADAQPTSTSSPLAGTWTIDLDRSTDLSPWRSYELTIEVKDDQIAIDRRLGWGRRTHAEVMTLDTSRDVNTVPLEYWVDNRHLGAYIGGDGTQQVRAQWIDQKRVLRLEADLTLETQQGERDVNILSQYHASPDGQTLTLTQLRSTRPTPVTYVFTRTAPRS